ncbi:hypothetical protein K443DRAFT_12142 [Laccaria amethystina LaAM-08-1]|uniref:Uncharacterized protein n=1 Tax=Laccaria amethystina LaAM-08-1 TaxID=1095629 RepID=A0A0C9X9Q8_9AGAR|nr:hypothetical protein K443DRAFT_12142 [Laccaria amethystina LaAM-08-1]
MAFGNKEKIREAAWRAKRVLKGKLIWICTRAYGTALAGARPFLQHWSQLAGGKPPGPAGTHV